MLTNLIAESAEILTPIIVIAGGLFWTRASTGISIAQIFASLTVIALVAEPLFTLVEGTAGFFGALASFQRIQEFLLLEEVKDTRENPISNVPVEETSEKQHQDSLFGVDVVKVSTEPLADGRQILRDINIHIPSQKTTMIIGAVGSGKSTLLKLILGEVKIIEGRIYVDKNSISYCDQSPWLQNTSIRNNIVGNYPFSEPVYKKILHTCHLLQDLDILPDGDRTVVGSGGCSLSGGQKLRVALARAIYANKGLLLLDDVFSGLDRSTAKSIFTRLLGPNGILRAAKSTVIMTTNFCKFLLYTEEAIKRTNRSFIDEHLPYADQVLRFSNSAELTKLEDTDELVQETYLQRATESQEDAAPEESDEASEKKEIAATEHDNENQDLDARQRGDFALWSYYLKSYGLMRVGLWALWAALTAAMENFPPVYMRIWLSVDRDNKLYFIGYAGSGIVTVISVIFMVLYGQMNQLWKNTANNLAGFRFLYRDLIVKSYKSFHWKLLNNVFKYVSKSWMKFE